MSTFVLFRTTKVTEMEKLNSFYCDNHLAAAVDAANLAADISVFDDHVADASKVKVGVYRTHIQPISFCHNLLSRFTSNLYLFCAKFSTISTVSKKMYLLQ